MHLIVDTQDNKKKTQYNTIQNNIPHTHLIVDNGTTTMYGPGLLYLTRSVSISATACIVLPGKNKK